MHLIDTRLAQAGILLPEAAAPAANYLPWVRHKGTVIISGQLPLEQGKLLFAGKVNSDADIETAQKAARLCGINLLAQLKAALHGDWDQLERCLRLGIFVNGVSGFTNAHLIANGVSNLMVEILGDAGKHARSTVSVAELPLGAMVEVEGLFAVTPG